MTAQLDRAMLAFRKEFATEIKNGDIVHLGTQGDCRRKNNTANGPYSEHAWPGGNAVDVMLRNWSGRKVLGDRIAKWMRANKGLWSEVFWWVTLHYDHVHGTANPRENYDNKQIPPCAGGEDDDMELIKALQTALNAGGFKGKTGLVLKVDGILGPNTQFALDSQAKAAAAKTSVVSHSHTVSGTTSKN